MRFVLGHILLFVVLLLTMTACSSDAILDDSSAADKEQVHITFTINMGGSTTRATTWGENDSPKDGTYYENTIEEGKLQVLLFTTANTYIGELSDMSFYRHPSSDDNIYEIVGSISVDKVNVSNGKLECKIVVLANYGDKASLNSGDNISAIENLSFDATTKYIPMFGVETYSGTNAIPLTSGIRANIGTIYLLRAMAKVRVCCETDGTELKSVTISNYNAKGYTLPKEYNADNTLAIDYKTVHPNESKEDGSLPFSEETDTEDQKKYWYIYVPEQSSTNKAIISVTYTDGSSGGSTTKSFNIGEYKKGKQETDSWIDIVRNHIYTYQIVMDDQLQIAYKVMPWTEGGTNTLDYKFTSTLSFEDGKVKKTSYTEGETTSEAVALAYSSDNTAEYSPWLTLKVETAFQWMVQTDNPMFGFVTKNEDGSVSEVEKYLSIDGSKTLTFKLVPLQELSLTDDNRSRKASIYVTAQSSADGVASKMPFNSDSALPGTKEEVQYYHVSRTDYDVLTTN